MAILEVDRLAKGVAIDGDFDATAFRPRLVDGEDVRSRRAKTGKRSQRRPGA